MNIFSSLRYKKGFTLVELMVAISIIGLLSAVVFSSFSVSRKKARVAERIGDLKKIQNALEFYYSVNRSYPVATSGSSECAGWGGASSNAVISGLVPTYMTVFPSDPQMDKAGNKNCYIYYSNGREYAVLDYNVTELSSGSAPLYTTYPELIDPARDGGTNNVIVDFTSNASISAWKVYSWGGRSL